MKKAAASYFAAFFVFQRYDYYREKIYLKFNSELFKKRQGIRVSNNITRCFSEERLEVLARKHHFTQRQSKLSAHEFVDTLMFSQVDHSQVSLQDCCNDVTQQHQKQYSKVALHKRFNQNSVDFLKAVLAEQLAAAFGNFSSKPDIIHIH